jgi:sugar lactone lactonase YvrE
MRGTARGQVQGGDLFATVNLGGSLNNGVSPVYQYGSQYVPPAGSPGIFASALDTPRGLAFDRFGNLFVENNHNAAVDPSIDPPVIQGSILKFTPDGLISTFATGFTSGFFLQGLATDSDGNLFVTGGPLADDNNPNPPATIYKITSDGTVSPFAPLPAQNLGIACDSSGNVYAATSDAPTATANGEILRFASNGTPDSSPFVGPTNYPNPEGPLGLAFDASGNLFASTTNGSNGDIRKFASDGTEIIPENAPHFATGLTKGPRGLVVDGAGNLFVAEIGIPGTAIAGDILQFTPAGAQSVFASTNFGFRGNRGPEWLAFTTGALAPPTSSVNLVLPDATEPLTATVTYIPQDSVPPPPSNFELTGSINLTFDIATTTTPTPPIIIAFTVPQSVLDQCGCAASTLKALHYENGNLVDSTIKQGDPNYPSNPAQNTVYASVNSLSPFVIATFKFGAQVQQPINADGTSIFNAKRGVIPVAFKLTSDGVATCQLPPATISVFRTSGGVVGSIDESTYLLKSDSGSNFRIDSTKCQYVYNLGASSLGPGTYKAYISIGGSVAGSATFALK